MPAIRNIGGAVTRLTRICTERKAGYTGGRYAGNEEMARRKLRAQMQASRAGIRAIAAAAAAAASLSSLSLSLVLRAFRRYIERISFLTFRFSS